MADVDALRKLLEAVEAGTDFTGHDLNIALAAIRHHAPADRTDMELAVWTRDAQRGSFDAAMRLHDALLPGWHGQIYTWGLARLWRPEWTFDDAMRDAIEGNAEAPARAWLIAILKAKIAETTDG